MVVFIGVSFHVSEGSIYFRIPNSTGSTAGFSQGSFEKLDDRQTASFGGEKSEGEN